MFGMGVEVVNGQSISYDPHYASALANMTNFVLPYLLTKNLFLSADLVMSNECFARENGNIVDMFTSDNSNLIW